MPLILLVEVVGKEGAADPAHNVSDEPKLKLGVRLGFTETV